MLKLSRGLTNTAEKFGIAPLDILVADLIALHYQPKDIALLLGITHETACSTAPSIAINKILEKPGMVNYRKYMDLHPKQWSISQRGNTVPNTEQDDNQTTDSTETTTPKDDEPLFGAKKLRDKESVIRELELTLPNLEGKERADVIMKIADLQQMKKEINKDDVDIIHYFLPQSCYNCSLFIRQQTQNPQNYTKKPIRVRRIK